MRKAVSLTFRSLCSVNKAGAPVTSVGLMGVKEDRNSSFLRGASNAPILLRKAFVSASNNMFSELDVNVSEVIKDFGDIEPSSSSYSGIFEAVRSRIQLMMRSNHRPFTLGGDHSITYALVKVVREMVGRPITIVHFDAHPDIYDAFEGDANSHASPFARICEEPNLCSQLISIGIRTLTPDQRKQIARFKVQVIEARHCGDINVVLNILHQYISDYHPVYVTFDMDVLEPGIAPGVSHREPGGLSTRQAIDFIHAIPGIIVGCDLVEFNPTRDVDGITATVGAKLMKELIAKMYISNLTLTQPINK